MKSKPALIYLASVVLGFVMIKPDAIGRPKSAESSPRRASHGHKEKPAERCTCANASKAKESKIKRTNGVTVKKQTRKLRPYFERKRGAPPFRGKR